MKNNNNKIKNKNREWEKLASSTKGIVTIAYWDTELNNKRPPPRLLGEYKGTPTIRLFKPKRKQRGKKGSNSDKVVIDYNHGERNVKDMKKFLDSYNGISNYVEKIKFGIDDYIKIQNKAIKYGLPIAVLFTSKIKSSATATSSPSIKWLSTEYRRRILVVEIPPVPKNNQLRQHIIGDIDNGDILSLPALYIIPPPSSAVVGSDADTKTNKIIKYNDNDYKRRKLQDFFNIHSLKESVYEPITIITNVVEGQDDDDEKDDEKNEVVKDEEKENDTKEKTQKQRVGVGAGEL
jgi:hypothetical protein